MEEEIILSDSDYFAVISYIFKFQKDKKSYASNIVRELYNINNENITRVPEYMKVLRILNELEDRRLIKKNKPNKKGEFKTYYSIILPNFTELIFNFLKSLPVYTGRTKNISKEINYKKNKYIHNFIGLHFRSISCDFLLYYRHLNSLQKFNLKDGIFLLMNQFLRYSPEKNSYLHFIEKNKKDKEKHSFALFLHLLLKLNEDYRLHSLYNKLAFDLRSYIEIVFKDNKESKINESWKKEIREIIEGKKDIFTYFPEY